MLWYRVTIVSLVIFCAAVHFVHSLQYSDVKALGIDCPEQHQCLTTEGPSMTRGCECDSACTTYGDCCIGIQGQPGRRATSPGSISCLVHGDDAQFGMYIVYTCSSNWSGSLKVKQTCEGIPNFSNPVNAAPVMSSLDGVTYKNRFCAECNNADIESLKTFDWKMSCEGSNDLIEESEIDELSYNQEMEKWGIYRVDAEGNTKFKECQLLFYLPRDLIKYVHFCRVDMISDCAENWPRPEDKKLCKEYTAVVYDKDHAYRNPHCAVCNNKTVSELRCKYGIDISSFTPQLFGMTDLINLNRICPWNQIFDPYVNKCRRPVCAIPGYLMIHGKCIPGSGY